MAKDPSLSTRLRADHRRLDDLLGTLIAALHPGDAMRALDAALTFGEALAEHTDLEESRLFPPRTDPRLIPRPEHTREEALVRELRIEHMQVRELATMIARQLTEKTDLGAARGLAANLARRWEAHTAREEAELLS